jgi:hypothetical protein
LFETPLFCYMRFSIFVNFACPVDCRAYSSGAPFYGFIKSSKEDPIILLYLLFFFDCEPITVNRERLRVYLYSISAIFISMVLYLMYWFFDR